MKVVDFYQQGHGMSATAMGTQLGVAGGLTLLAQAATTIAQHGFIRLYVVTN